MIMTLLAKIVGKFNKENQQYEIGENAILKLEVNNIEAGEREVLKLRWTFDGGRIIEEQKISVSNNQELLFEKTMLHAGFLRLEATLESDIKLEYRKVFSCGFGIDSIKGVENEPIDFDEFWATSIAEAEELPENFQVCKLEEFTNSKYITYQVGIQSLNNRMVYGILTIPILNGKTADSPLIIKVSGAGAGMGFDDGYASEGIGLLTMNVFETPVELDEKSRDLAYAKFNQNVAYYYRGCESKEQYFFRSVFVGFNRLVNKVITKFEIDVERVGLMGSSQGGGSVLMLAALNKYPKMVVANVPAMCDWRAKDNAYASGWPQLLNYLDTPATRNVAQYFDIVNFAKRVKIRSKIVVGFIDEVCPPTTVYAMYNNLGTFDKTIINMPSMAHVCQDIFNITLKKELINAIKNNDFPILGKSTPEQEGIRSQVIQEFIEKLNEFKHIHKVIIAKNGKEIFNCKWSPYEWGSRHVLFSLTKSMTSLAIGLCYDDDLLDLDDKVIDYFPEINLEYDLEFWHKMTIRHLLTMTTGHSACPVFINGNVSKLDYMDGFFQTRLIHEPGSTFVYNTGATHIASAIIHKVAKVNMSTLLRDRIFRYLNISNYEFKKTVNNIDIGGVGGFFCTEDLAKIGQLILQKGNYNGRQLISEEYLAMATAKQVNSVHNEALDWKEGYGFQFWRSRHDTFRGDGACGQFIIFLDKFNTVITINSGMANMGMVLNEVWNILLPKLTNCKLPEDFANYSKLLHYSSRLNIPKLTNKIESFEVDKSFVLDVNQQAIKELKLFTTGDYLQLKLKLVDRVVELVACNHDYFTNKIIDCRGDKRTLGVTFSYDSPNRLIIKSIDLENIYIVEHEIDFNAANLIWNRKMNLPFLYPFEEKLTGVLKS